MLTGPFLDKDFIGSNKNYSKSEAVLLGMPYDCTCSNRPGTRFAPQQIRVESVGIETYSPYFDIDITDINFYDAGDLEFPFGNAKKMLEIAYETAQEHKRTKIKSENILYGITKTPNCLAMKVLGNLGTDVLEIQQGIKQELLGGMEL